MVLDSSIMITDGRGECENGSWKVEGERHPGSLQHGKSHYLQFLRKQPKAANLRNKKAWFMQPNS